MRLWRLCESGFLATALDGEGAQRFGGRWNKAGRRMVYLSEHLSLAALEVLVNARRYRLSAHVAIALEIPDDLAVRATDLAELPGDWRDAKVPDSTQAFGDEWLARASEALMRVPSVIIPEEHNYLLNPEHPGARRIKVASRSTFSFDPRLFRD